jgi:hypothetical protein
VGRVESEKGEEEEEEEGKRGKDKIGEKEGGKCGVGS